MRTSEDPHRDAAPYALGVLDAADAYRFEDHLLECPDCSFAVTDFAVVRAELDAYLLCTPPGVPLLTDAGGELLDRTVHGAARVARRGRRRRYALAAAAAVLVVAGPLGVLTAGDGVQSGRTAPHRFTGLDTVTGTTAVATAAPRPWGAAVGFELSAVDVRGACVLVAVGRDGSRETVTSWSSRADTVRPVVTSGGAAMHPREIDHFEVRADGGHRLLVLHGG